MDPRERMQEEWTRKKKLEKKKTIMSLLLFAHFLIQLITFLCFFVHRVGADLKFTHSVSNKMH